VQRYATFPVSFGLRLVAMALQLKLRGNPALASEAS
jgi:hypothetical protein